MNDKQELYSLKWVQEYPQWEEMVDVYMDMILEASEYKEAKQVIEQVKKNL